MSTLNQKFTCGAPKSQWRKILFPGKSKTFHARNMISYDELEFIGTFQENVLAL